MGAADHMAATTGSRTAAEFLNNVVRPMLAMEGDKLPVRWVLVRGGSRWCTWGVGGALVCCLGRVRTCWGGVWHPAPA